MSNEGKPCASWTMNDDGLPRSEMSWVCEAGGFKRVGQVILTVYTVFAVKNNVLTCYGVWVVLEAVAIEKKVERGAIGLTFN